MPHLDGQLIVIRGINLKSYLDFTQGLIGKGLSFVKSNCTQDGKVSNAYLDMHQNAVFELAVAYSQTSTAECYLQFAAGKSDRDQALAHVFVADVCAEVCSRLKRCAADFGLAADDFKDEFQHLAAAQEVLGRAAMSDLGEAIAADQDLGSKGLGEEHVMMADTFRQFGEDVVAPLAEDIHRQDQLIPDAILNGLRDLGCFGLSVPEKFGGLLPDEGEDSIGMIVVTEELSRASLGAAGSLITRPEIMSRALLEGGTPEQQEKWLPKIAAGDPLCGIALTEPDYGSDVASMKLKATQVEGGWLLSGAKTWSTFAGKAGLLLTIARSNPDLSFGHRGLSLFICEKPSFEGESFEYKQPGGGSLSGTAIPTVGYRGMHSYQLFYDDFFVPDENVVGESQGLGRGFYFTMRGLMGGRIQTAARACGVMQAAFDRAVRYANERKVFGQPIAEFELTRSKLARMAAYISAARQMTYAVGRLMDEGKGQTEASLVKLFACKSAEWVAREAMQIHGGMGYAEETPVSRYWQDARVLSIFEGTEETLALKVIGRNLVENAH
jgi:(2S)-methylsuccinyl-CoA dehydrogenase